MIVRFVGMIYLLFQQLSNYVQIGYRYMMQL